MVYFISSAYEVFLGSFIPDMDSENPFTNEETSSEDDDSTKKLKTIWVGIANSTDKDLKISTWSYFSIPDSTSGDDQHRTQLFCLNLNIQVSNLVLD